jgi:hypothetical protein
VELNEMFLQAVMLPKHLLTEIAAVVLTVQVFFVIVFFPNEPVGFDVKVCQSRFVPASVRGQISGAVENFFAFRASILNVNNHTTSIVEVQKRHFK